MSATRKDSAQDTITELGVVLQRHGFINVTGLREYIWFIPTRTVGKGLLHIHICSYAFVGLPEIVETTVYTQNGNYGGGFRSWSIPIDDSAVYLLIVTNDATIWLGRPSKAAVGLADGVRWPSKIDVRLSEYADRTNDRSFTSIVRPQRLRHRDLFQKFAEIAPAVM